jgi:nucleoside-diphosphate-sugar epimerase
MNKIGKRDYSQALTGKHIALTGANGFMGSFAARQILEASVTRITALVRPDSMNRRIKALQQQYPARVAIVPCDTATLHLKRKDEIASIQKAIQGAHALLHYAGAPKLSNSTSVADLVRKANTVGTRNVINFIRKMKDPPFFAGIGSLFETGIVNGVIYEEQQHGNAFRNPYERSKWEAANIARSLFDAGKLKGYWFRPAIITGESRVGAGSENGNLKGPVMIFAIAAMRKIHLFRYAVNSSIGLPFSHVDHVNAAILFAVATQQAPNGACFHLFSNQHVHMGDLAQLTARIINEKRCRDPRLWGGTAHFGVVCDCRNGVVKPQELMMYAGTDAPVTTYHIDKTNTYRYLPPELANPPLDISRCVQYVLNQFEIVQRQKNA